MSRKKKQKNKETTIEDFYDLKIDKVDELVEALKSSPNADVDAEGNAKEPLPMTIAECTGEATPDTKTRTGKDKRFDPYKLDKFSRIPVWLKAIFIKFWFAGAVCYFVMFGLSLYFAADDLFIISGLILGILVDFIINPIFRMLESDDKEYNRYMMFPFPVKVFWTFLTNIIYYIFVMFVVSYAYTGLNMLINLINGAPDHHIAVGVEPLLCGIFAVIVDMAFIGLKDLLVWLIRKNKRKKALAEGELQAETDAAFGVNSANSEGRGAPAATGGAEGDVSAAAADIGQPQAEIDEVEKLRRLAESRNNAADKNAVKKNKKK